jgi:Ca2+-transporting ATPase
MKWYKFSLDELAGALNTDIKNGLSKGSLINAQNKYGVNILPKIKKTTWFQFLFRQFRSPLVYILLIGAFFTLYIREWVDLAVILLAVIVNVLVGFWQEFRSNDILEKLEDIIETSALVIRGGKIHEVNSEVIVPGDLIVLKMGNKIPADARIIESHSLEIDEAILTGEASPVRKHSIAISGDVQISDRKNMVHMGSLVARGDGLAIVVATGEDTEFGKIAVMTQSAEEEPTPLQTKIGKLGEIIAIIIGLVSLLIFVVGILGDYQFSEMLTITIAVAVAAIPEGLPAAISIVLAIGAKKILKKQGVVKRLVATETLGTASVICTDKTGSLTKGEMAIKKLSIKGNIKNALNILYLANEAVIEDVDGEQIVRGETTDKAKMEYFLNNGGDTESALKRFKKISVLTFNSSLKYIASLYNDQEDDSYQISVNGAPEILLGLSKFYLDKEGVSKTLDESTRDQFIEEYKKLAGEGFRVLGLAERTLDRGMEGIDKKDLEAENDREELVSELVFVGLAAINDPIREDVRVSIVQARNAGIKIIMITGDHLLTARAIGGNLGFSKIEGAVMEGEMIEPLSDSQLRETVKRVEIFARVNPEHKMRIINALQKNGEVVAMIGDGVNDAPALKSSNIGVAVGSGTDLAKAASDLILLDDSFSIVVAAIKEGRIAFDNIRKITVFLLAGSFTELILIVSAILFKFPFLPVTAVMILWTNLVGESLPNIALSFEPGEKDVMNRPPLKKDKPVLDMESKTIVFVVGILADFLLLGVFLYSYYVLGMEQVHLQTLIFASLGFNMFLYIFSIKNLKEHVWNYRVFSNKYLNIATVIGVLLMLLAIYLPGLNNLMGTTPLMATDWFVVIGLGLIHVTGIEIAKWWFFFREKTKNTILSETVSI